MIVSITDTADDVDDDNVVDTLGLLQLLTRRTVASTIIH